MKNKKLVYYAILDEKKSPGIAKKIINTVSAAKEIGFTSVKKVFKPKNNFAFLKEIVQEKSDYIYIRYPGWILFLLFFILIYKKIKGKIIIIDIPTPRKIVLKEIEDADRPFIIKLVAKFLLIVSGSWILWPAHRVIQYADESLWFSFGVKQKTLKIGNGINIDSTIPLVKNTPKSDCFNLIVVAQLAGWHGYDRLINAVALLKIKYPEFEVTAKIVGEGTALTSLKQLVKELRLENEIVFTGFLYGEDLNKAFENMDIAVSSLGLYRKGLNEASDLKTREYIARGLCVIGVGKDPDFSDDSPYRFLVPNNDEIEELADVIYKLNSMQLPSPEEVRSYAEKNLALKSKVEKIFNFNK